ncbi:MAG: bacteriohopanetetrol glucosamine biosynthesis glycosyltransferase HpnI [Candidatus Binatia bacterium]|nr:bacteriohopanetetrol glucosamine biosynthesis glycosyltransferase HpnI [Candidatus Binatia bacterium]
MAFFFSLLIAGLLLAACAYYLFSLYAAWCLLHRASSPPLETTPPVSLLKPLKGAPPDLYANLATFCQLKYPVFQLLCGVKDPHDPAVTVVQRLQQDFPDRDIALLVTPEVIGPNYKVSTLHHLFRAAKYDLCVITDSDIRVEPHYLRAIIPPLLAAEVGLVTCPYRASASHPFPALLESLIITTSFTPSIFVARLLEPTTYAFGATLAVKRHCLTAIGGFTALADYLADDYYLGYLVAHSGYRVCIVPHVVETRPDVGTLSGLLSHQLRWARTQRTCRPAGYCGTFVTHGTVWALCGLSFFWSTAVLPLLAVVTLWLRLVTATVMGKVFLRSALPLRSFLLVPIADVISFLVWCLSFCGNTVRWHEHTFRIVENGKMVRIG